MVWAPLVATKSNSFQRQTDRIGNGVIDEDVEIEWRFLPAAWLRLEGFTLSQSRILGQWKYVFTPICIRPDSSRIFEACQDGDLDEVIRLVRSGRTTVFDTIGEGWTLLHVGDEVLK